jgi:hypothetical protein
MYMKNKCDRKKISDTRSHCRILGTNIILDDKREKFAYINKEINAPCKETSVMEAFSPTPPDWINHAVHSFDFQFPQCRETARKAEKVWINRRSPVMTEDYRRKWQEFYQCECGQGWWGWSSDRPPSDLIRDK